MNMHIDTLAEWWENAEESDDFYPGDTWIKRRQAQAGGYVYDVGRVTSKKWYYEARVLERAPKPKPAWHDAVAILARSVFDEADMYSGRRVMTRAGFGDERWWDSSNEKLWEDDELADVTPLIEAKVTDEMVEHYQAEEAKWRLEGGPSHPSVARHLLTAALGLETS